MYIHIHIHTYTHTCIRPLWNCNSKDHPVPASSTVVYGMHPVDKRCFFLKGYLGSEGSHYPKGYPPPTRDAVASCMREPHALNPRCSGQYAAEDL